jgi:hypothetical protein
VRNVLRNNPQIGFGFADNIRGCGDKTLKIPSCTAVKITEKTIPVKVTTSRTFS